MSINLFFELANYSGMGLPNMIMRRRSDNRQVAWPGLVFATSAMCIGIFQPSSAFTAETSNVAPFVVPLPSSRPVVQSECGPSPLSPEEVRSIIIAKAAKYGVDPKFALAVGYSESRFGLARDSKAGARGEMQLIPATASRYGVSDICDPESNIDASMRYIKDLFVKFKDPVLVAAAYNSGEGSVYQYKGVPPFKETLNYVSKILNYQINNELLDDNNKYKQVNNQNKSAAFVGIGQGDPTNGFVGGVWNF
ncbi:lytic transglycosylase domain-containing protein [Allorhizobium sp. BGMRC 0089]|uniref:lytic transglycosylase domain-containing protein n=1 Tax=Allorhizobium sonneratiae TaxID=2934936 RepID=UPI0020344F59|nr:lytic transglycosylase domain-containing protein [Allorhizobium sonneratiae]MCM2294704.1 lytic transglycosylase domain-containing protein [Allorhizobium sonneratiae]